MLFSSWLWNRTSNRPAGRRPAKPIARFRPQLESLDGRLLPSFVPAGGVAGDGVVAVGDFNNDKRLDMASVSVGDWQTLHVQLGTGTGQFSGSTIDTVLGGAGVTSIAVGKFNTDKYLDVILTTYDTVSGINGVRIYFGKGDGTFAAGANYGISGGPAANAAVAVGDFNGDKRLDAVTSGDNGTNVLLGNGKGSFKSGKRVGPGGPGVAVGDIDADGRLDIVAGTWSLLGNGDGTFRATQSLPIPGTPASVALADFNRDGKLDLVSTNSTLSNGYLSWETDVLLGNGDGTFKPAWSVGLGGDGVAVADFNQDGRLDIVTVSNSGSFIALGNGDGTFQAPLDIGLTGQGVAVGDLNGDGYSDLAVGGLAYLNDGKW